MIEEENLDTAKLGAHEKKLLSKYEAEVQEMTEKEKEAEKNEFDTKVWDEFAPTLHDPLFVVFQTQISFTPEQVIRYDREDTKLTHPLWYSRVNRLRQADIPACPHCQGPRVFEFQVLPQLLYYLKIDPVSDDALDWGTICVYTCKASCGEPTTGYVEEHVHLQVAQELKSDPSLYAHMRKPEQKKTEKLPKNAEKEKARLAKQQGKKSKKK